MLGAEFKQRRELLIRRGKTVTQEQCAKELHRHVDSIRNWENGRIKIPFFAVMWLERTEHAQRKRFAREARNG